MNPGARGLVISFDDVVRATGVEVVRAPSGSVALQGVWTDSRAAQPGGLFIGIPGEKFDGSDFAVQAVSNGAAAVLVSKEKASVVAAQVNCAVLATESTLRAFGLLARWHRRRMGAKIVAVTGSNGKTTTKEMLAAILAQVGATLATEGNLNNEIGTPLTLLGLRPEHRFGVIEIGMNHEGEISRLTAMVEPDVGIVTLAAPVHVENLGSLENVARAKGELYLGMPLEAVAVANADDELMAERAKWAGRRATWFGRSDRADVQLVRILSHDARGLACLVRVHGREHELQLPVVGLHNAMNACAALAAADALGVPVDAALQGLSTARPPGRRLRLTPIPGTSATLLDDCYNANPHSTVAAVATLAELAPVPHRIAVLGDMRELGADEIPGHRLVGEAVAKADVKLLVAFGTSSREIAEGARLAGLDPTRILHTSEPTEAAERVRSVLTSNDLVLVKASRGTRLERVSDLLAPPAREEQH